MRVHQQRMIGEPRRAGFTVLEMLVVMSIMAVLAALVAAAVFRAMSVQPTKDTQLLILKLKDTLHQQWLAAASTARAEPIPPQILSQLMNMAGNDQQAARELWIKVRLAQEFPESAQQAMNPGAAFGVGGLQGLASYFEMAGVPPEFASSACLYAALKRNRGVDFDPETMSPREVGTVPGTKVKYFKDAWDQPLTFQNGLSGGDPKAPPRYIIASPGQDMRPGNADDISSDKVKQGDY